MLADIQMTLIKLVSKLEGAESGNVILLPNILQDNFLRGCNLEHCLTLKEGLFQIIIY